MSIDYAKIVAGTAEKSIGKPSLIRVLSAGSGATLRFGGEPARPLRAGAVYLNEDGREISLAPGAYVDLEYEEMLGQVEVIPPAVPRDTVQIVDGDGVPVIGQTAAPVPVIVTDINGGQAGLFSGSVKTAIQKVGNTNFIGDLTTAMPANGAGGMLYVAPMGRDTTGQGHPPFVTSDGRPIAGRQDWVEVGNGSSLASGVVNVDIALEGYSEAVVYVRNNHALNNYAVAYEAKIPEGAGTQLVSIEAGAPTIAANGGIGGGYMGPGGRTIADGKLTWNTGFVPSTLRIVLPATAAPDDLEAFVLAR